jgi:predicted acylesterase/phospholipase RssA
LNTGQVIVFDETTPMEIRNKSLISSASIPFVFPPVEIDGMQLVDGGTFQNVAIGDPI